MSQQTTPRENLIACLVEMMKREFLSDTTLMQTLAGQTPQSNYLVIDGGDAEGRTSGSNYQT